MKRKIVIILLVILGGSFSIAQQKTFTLEEAIKRAIQNNRELKIAKMDVDKAEAAVDEAFGYALPSLDVSGSFSHFLQKPKMPFPDFETLLSNATYGILFDEGVIPYDPNKLQPVQTELQSFAQTNNYEANANLTQIIFNSAVFRGIGASQIYLDLSQKQLEAKLAKTVVDVKKAFYGVLLTQQLYEITKSSLDNAKKNLSNVEAMYEQGMVSEFDLLQVEVQVENIKPRVKELENSLISAKNGLKIIMNLEQSMDIEVEGELDYQDEVLPNAGETIQDALDSNLEIRSLEIKKQVDKEMISIDRSEFWPTVTAFGNYKYAGSSDEWDFQNYSQTTVGVNFSINLFKGFRVSNKIQQSEIAAKQTDEQISQLKDFVSKQVRDKIEELKRVQTQIAAMNRNVELAEKAYEIAKKRYEEGKGTQLEIKNADLELRKARTNKVKAIHDYTVAKAELNKLLGKLNSEYIDFVDEKLEKE
jgi:outer membrane protein TolC